MSPDGSKHANPYQPPPLSPEVESSLATESSFDPTPARWGFEFVSDWTRQGLRQREVRGNHHWHFIIMMAMAITLVSIAFTTGYGGPICLSVPLVLGAIYYWLSQTLSRIQGRRFDRHYPAFSGRVAGVITNRFIAVRGPHASLATRLYPKGCRRTPHSIQVTFPFTRYSIPIDSSDLTRELQADEVETLSQADQAIRDLQAPSSSRGETIEVGGELLGSDFQGTRRYELTSVMMLVGIACCACLFVASLSFAASAAKASRATGNSVSISQRASQLRTMCFLSAISAIAALTIPGWQFINRKFGSGHFHVMVARDWIAIRRAGFHACYAYHGDTLDQVRWHRAGLTVVRRNGAITMLFPARWFDEAQVEHLKAWFPEDKQLPSRELYVGPVV